MNRLAPLIGGEASGQTGALLLQNVAFIALAVWCWRRQGATVGDVGLAPPSARQIVRWLVLGVGVFAVAFLAGALLERALAAALAPRQFDYLVRENRRISAEGAFLRIAGSTRLKALFVCAGAVVAPIGEEALFRGLIYRSVRAHLGVRAAVLGSSLLFAVVHVSILIMPVIFIIGMMLACAYQRTGSLWAPILMHAVSNGLMFVLLWQQSR